MELLFGLALVMLIIGTALINWLSIRKQSQVTTIQPQRKLTTLQTERFSRMLKEAPMGTTSITAMLGDEESLALAREINLLLSRAGWQTQEVKQTALANNPTELTLIVDNADKKSSTVDSLMNIFHAVGLPVLLQIAWNGAPQPLNLIVGHQPELKGAQPRDGLYL